MKRINNVKLAAKILSLNKPNLKIVNTTECKDYFVFSTNLKDDTKILGNLFAVWKNDGRIRYVNPLLNEYAEYWSKLEMTVDS